MAPCPYSPRTNAPQYSPYSIHYADRIYPEFCPYEHASSSVSSSGTSHATAPRTPSRLCLGHRRTPSNVSNASSSTNNSVNPEEILYRRDYEYPPLIAAPSPYFSRQNSSESTPSSSCVIESRLRSSLKRYNYNTSRKTSTGAETPTNATPPDSLTSEDSSYVSAKESSYSSVSRVRFSPVMAQEVVAEAARRQRRSSSSRRPSLSDAERSEFLS